jgi:hypothetical protein
VGHRSPTTWTFNGSPNGIRIRVSTLRGWCPRPLDDGAVRRNREGCCEPFRVSSGGRTRTFDFLIQSQAFCQLNYPRTGSVTLADPPTACARPGHRSAGRRRAGRGGGTRSPRRPPTFRSRGRAVRGPPERCDRKCSIDRGRSARNDHTSGTATKRDRNAGVDRGQFPRNDHTSRPAPNRHRNAVVDRGRPGRSDERSASRAPGARSRPSRSSSSPAPGPRRPTGPVSTRGPRRSGSRCSEACRARSRAPARLPRRSPGAAESSGGPRR